LSCVSLALQASRTNTEPLGFAHNTAASTDAFIPARQPAVKTISDRRIMLPP